MTYVQVLCKSPTILTHSVEQNPWEADSHSTV